MWQSSISKFSQIWQYSKYEKDWETSIHHVGCGKHATCPNCGMGGATLKESILLLCPLTSIEIFLKMRHKYEKVIVWWSFSTVLNKHNLIVENLGILFFWAEIHTTSSSHAIFVAILFEANIVFSSNSSHAIFYYDFVWIRFSCSHWASSFWAVFALISSEGEYHILSIWEELLLAQYLVWFFFKGNIMFSLFTSSHAIFFAVILKGDFYCLLIKLILMQSSLLCTFGTFHFEKSCIRDWHPEVWA